MKSDIPWQLRPGVKMTPEVAGEVAKIACALKSLSAYTALVLEQEDNPAELQQLVDEGNAAINRLFVI